MNPQPKTVRVPRCPECHCPRSYHRKTAEGCVMADAGGGNCGCQHYRPKPRKPIARKRATPRKRKHTCSIRGCNRVPTAGVMCLTHAKAKADEAWSAAVRNGRCDLAEWHNRFQQCGGVIQGNHGVPRGFMGTRYLLENGFSGCAGINKWAKDHGAQWDRALRLELWGQEKYDRLWAIANNFGRDGQATDYAEIIRELSGQK